MNMKAGRAYDQTLRAQQAAETQDRMLHHAERLFSTELFDRVTLAAVARAAGVSIPTLQRSFGNKEGLFAAVGARVRARVLQQRQPPSDDVDAALTVLLLHYEQEGALTWNLLKQETDVAPLGAALSEARAVHRRWVEQVFARSLASVRGSVRQRRVDALVAATDLYLWKLLRVDLGRTAQQVAHTLKAMAHAVARGEE